MSALEELAAEACVYGFPMVFNLDEVDWFTRAFWSITMYGAPEYFLVDNAIDRYSIGDRTPRLHHGDDDSLTLYLQPEAPSDPQQAANWLPTPDGPFRPILRMYQPRAAVFDGSFTLPPISRAVD